jgi:hypothetical protein
VAHRHNPPIPIPIAAQPGAGTELAWWAGDDPKPFFVMLARLLRPAMQYLRHRWFGSRRARTTVRSRKDIR